MYRIIISVSFFFLFYSSKSQELNKVDLGVIEAELEIYRGLVSWVNPTDGDVIVKAMTNAPILYIEDSLYKVPVGETLTIPYVLKVSELRGKHVFSIRLTDEEGVLFTSVDLSVRILSDEKNVKKSYPYDLWPFWSKKRIFSLGAGFSDGVLTKGFTLYHLSGDTVDMTGLHASNPYYQFEFYPDQIANHDFGRLKISVLPFSPQLGFVRENVTVYNYDSSAVMRFPIQYTLEEGGYMFGQGNPPHMLVSKKVHDFKVVREGDQRETSVILSNAGSGILHIKEVESNCDCLTYSLNTNEVVTHGRATLKVTFDASGRGGYERKTLALFTNDPRNPTQVIVFKAHVK